MFYNRYYVIIFRSTMSRSLRNYCFMVFIFYFIHNEFQAHGAVTLIKHLRQGSDELNHLDEEDNISAEPEDSETGFDLDEDDISKFHIWPLGVIPYYIDDYSFDKVLRDKIRAFLEHASSITGLRFLELLSPPEDNSRWVFFINRQGLLGCADNPFESFTNEGVQKVVLGYDCLRTEYGLAETILSLVGVPPQHNAPNRDKFIKINKDNIMPEKVHLFNVLRDDEWLFHDIEYDFKSAGHYDSHRYTINGAATIVPQDEMLDIEIGHGKCFTNKDIQKIKMLYNYIILKHKANVQLPECLKIFSVGPNFKKFTPKKNENIAPRKKPNKYLGIESEAADKADYKSNSKEMENSSKASKKENNQSNMSHEGTVENEEQQTHETHEKSDENFDQNNNTEATAKSEERISENEDTMNTENDAKKGNNRSQTLKKKSEKYNMNKNKNLLDLSDFETGETH